MRPVQGIHFVVFFKKFYHFIVGQCTARKEYEISGFFKFLMLMWCRVGYVGRCDDNISYSNINDKLFTGCPSYSRKS